MKVRRGPLLESVRLTFADGYSLRVGGLPRRQSRPLERYLAGEADALDPSRLTPEQLTNFCQAMAAVGLWPRRREVPGRSVVESRQPGRAVGGIALARASPATPRR